jgi:flagellin-like hook-associated protein FlgL
MPVNGYSTYAAYLSNVNGFQRLQTSLATLTQQLNSGKKSSDLTTYGVEAQRLVDLRAEIARRQGYMEAIKSAATDVKAYDRVFESVEDINATMMQAFTAPTGTSSKRETPAPHTTLSRAGWNAPAVLRENASSGAPETL